MQQQRRKNIKRKALDHNIDPLREMIRWMCRKPKFKKLHGHLEELDNFVGMEEVKKNIVQQIQFIISNNNKTDGHFLNCVLSGPPGCGKTSLAEVLYKIWSSLGLFKGGSFHILHRADFIGSFMGTTCNKTKKVLEKHRDGVIFVDEAYSLLSGEKDEYGKEALDVINSFLSEEKGRTVMIISGYKKDLEDTFFKANKGLKRRFNWNFHIKGYDAQELFCIFQRQLEQHGWKCEKGVRKLFEKHYVKFKHFGGDCENVAFKAKIQFSKRNWKKKRGSYGRVLSYEDCQHAIESHFKVSNDENNAPSFMYL